MNIIQMIGLVLIVPFIFLVIYAETGEKHNEVVKCYDGKDNEIIGMKCYEVAYNRLPNGWVWLVPITGTFLLVGLLVFIYGYFKCVE